MSELSAGKLLIANPFLKDLNFLRSVILLCNHEEAGSFGFVLNQEIEITLNQLVTEINNDTFKVYRGGPVQLDSLHFLHNYSDLLGESVEVLPGVYWGGNYETLKILLNNGSLEAGRIKFFVGYSGWSAGQLETEMKEETWITADAFPRLIFDVPAADVWKESLNHLGGKYKMMINFPLDPQLN